MTMITFCRVSIQGSLECLLLTRRAIENAPLPQFFTYDNCITALAREPRAPVDGEGSLEAAWLARGITEIPIRRAPQPHRFPEHVFHGVKEPGPISLRHFPDESKRSDASAIEHFAPIDIADAGDLVLFQKEGRNLFSRAFLEKRTEEAEVAFARERITAERSDRLHRLNFQRRHTVDPAEFPEIRKIHP